MRLLLMPGNTPIFDTPDLTSGAFASIVALVSLRRAGGRREKRARDGASAASA